MTLIQDPVASQSPLSPRGESLQVYTPTTMSLVFQFISGSLLWERREIIYVLRPWSTGATPILIVKRPEATVFTTLKES